MESVSVPCSTVRSAVVVGVREEGGRVDVVIVASAVGGSNFVVPRPVTQPDANNGHRWQ